ncbi:SDR family NAD(P)-dependent oxidoreductase [Lentilactobacillus hilgardii]|uniref:SDR family NAD(P)-dependent oxidoreductase n=1 Tax=Lentilactobacillus hilgardii TaxID=1588 RepID=UPI0021A9078D|nr:SDR family NAD(P)-dependent oxidoreductase [Lentilactobacillus hilgardii]
MTYGSSGQQSCYYYWSCKGIGLSCAKRFVNEGARVIGTDVDEETGRENISKLGDNAIFIRHDVSKEEEW